MEFQTIRFEIDKGIAYITLSRPEQRNAVNRQMIAELDKAIDIIEQTEEVKAILVTGNDHVFASGADITEIHSCPSQAEFMTMVDQGHKVLRRLEQLDKPSIAVVRGLAYGGGCEISLACDFRVAADNARFGIPEIRLGLIPGWGGASRLQKLLPFPRFKEMLLTGEPISAEEALCLGLVNRVVPLDQALDAGLQLAGRLTDKSPFALKIAKRLAIAQFSGDVLRSIELEKQAIAVLFGTEDRLEGTAAFVEKRSPVWRGR